MKERILPAYLTDGNQVAHSFMISMLRMVGYSLHGRDAVVLDPIRMRVSAGGLAQGRNDLTKQFLAGNAEWLWMIDTDMGFHPDTPHRLLAAAKDVEAPVVGALCFSLRHEAPDGLGGYVTRPVPTVYGWDGKGFRAVTSYPLNTRVKTAATGAACLLIHRSAAEKLQRECGEEWWTPVRYPDGRMLGEDLSFCYRLGEQGLAIYVDTSIPTTHAKLVHLDESAWLDRKTLDDHSTAIAREVKANA